MIDAPDNLRSRVMRGIGWKIVSQIVLQVSRIAVAVVLARLLTPSDYGLAAMVLVFSSLVVVFSDLALGAALVQRKHLTEADRSTVFWTSVAAGVALHARSAIALAGPARRLLRRARGPAAVRGAVAELLRQRARRRPRGAADCAR